ncbi:hypothetical protein K1719_019828 [Acacia pycnantha]|nr:hypothetical protein K1719_019828 [Acacia pycnantha]
MATLKEGPDGTDAEDSRGEGRWGHWMKGPLARTPSVSSSSACKRSDLRLLLGVLGAPLAPVHVSTADPFSHLSIKDIPIVSFCFLSFFPFIYIFRNCIYMPSVFCCSFLSFLDNRAWTCELVGKSTA